MKTTALRTWLAVGVSVLALTGAMRVFADQATATEPVKQDQKIRTYTGTVTAVDPNGHRLGVKGDFMLSRNFNLGDSCVYALLDNNTAAGLRPGERVKVAFVDDRGILVASRVDQLPMRHEGAILTIDPNTHMLTMRSGAVTRQLQIADDCRVVLRGERSGTLTDIKPGHYVTVTYETPKSGPVVYEIAQTSETFSGSLTAIDINERTLKASSVLGTKQFQVGKDCAVVINGQTGNELRNLKPDDKLVISYDDVDGVNVVNRIATNESVPESTTASTHMTDPATPY